jgi:hypothetical protein
MNIVSFNFSSVFVLLFFSALFLFNWLLFNKEVGVSSSLSVSYRPRVCCVLWWNIIQVKYLLQTNLEVSEKNQRSFHVSIRTQVNWGISVSSDEVHESVFLNFQFMFPPIYALDSHMVLSFKFQDQYFASISPFLATYPSNLIFLDFYHPSNIWRSVRICTGNVRCSSLYTFLQLPFTFLFLNVNVPLSTLFSNILSVCVSGRATHPVSYPQKKTA